LTPLGRLNSLIQIVERGCFYGFIGFEIVNH
jgi:hypothetical protein